VFKIRLAGWNTRVLKTTPWLLAYWNNNKKKIQMTVTETTRG